MTSGASGNDAVIIDVVRTGSGRGKPGGALSALHPVELLAQVLTAVVERTGIDPAEIDDVITGCVSQAGEQTFNLARNAVLAAGFGVGVPGVTIDRQCGSSQQAVHFAAQGVLAGAYDLVIACGVESMSRVPMGSPAAGHDAYGPRVAERFAPGLVPQGISAELIAQTWEFERDAVDAYAAESHRRAAAAAAAGQFDAELVPVVIGVDGTDHLHASDETIRPSTTVEGLAGLKPSFVDEAWDRRFPGLRWLITAGNASPLTDGASAALIMSARRAEQLGLTPRARFAAFAVVGDDPVMMLTGPIPATKLIMKRSGLTLDAMDVYEVNEAFAPVPMAWAKELGADPARLNPRGGAIALGHPLGASGTKLLATMVNHLEQTEGRYGLQTMCEGGGMANAMIIERL